MHQKILLLAVLSQPRAALLLAGAGVCGVCCELAGAGRILPGVLGTACLVLGLASPSASKFDVPGLILVAASLACFMLDAALGARAWLSGGGAVLLVYGLHSLGMGWLPSTGFGLVFSASATYLLTVAAAARRNKLGILKT